MWACSTLSPDCRSSKTCQIGTTVGLERGPDLQETRPGLSHLSSFNEFVACILRPRAASPMHINAKVSPRDPLATLAYKGENAYFSKWISAECHAVPIPIPALTAPVCCQPEGKRHPLQQLPPQTVLVGQMPKPASPPKHVEMLHSEQLFATREHVVAWLSSEGQHHDMYLE